MSNVISYKDYLIKQNDKYDKILKSEHQESLDTVINKISRLYKWNLQDKQ